MIFKENDGTMRIAICDDEKRICSILTKSWGGKLPGISQDTLAAANKLFDDYYNSKGVQTTE